MNNADKPAYPTNPRRSDDAVYDGLTKRERFAMAAMQGMLPEFKSDKSQIPHQNLIAEYAVHYADALLKKLEETK